MELPGKLGLISDLLTNDKKCKTDFNTCGHTMLGCFKTTLPICSTKKMSKKG